MLLTAVLAVLVAAALADETVAPTTTSFVTPTPSMIGEYYRPYFWQDHPNLCGRLPELKITNEKTLRSWEYYSNIEGKPHLIYLAEAQCGTCQSNAAIAGQLSKRWEEYSNNPRRQDEAVDMGVFAINRNFEPSKKKFNMMKNRLAKRFSVGPWVSLHQDNDLSNFWDTLGDYQIENTGEFFNETRQFRSKRNDMYLVDQWGRMIRFLRDAILIRSRKQDADTNLLWRNVIQEVMVATKERKSVCDELQHEWLYCRIPEEWELNGVSFRNLRQGRALTVLVFIRADMDEFTVNGLLRDLIDLSERWNSPSYVVVADSVPQSKTRFATVDLYMQTRNSDVRLLQDEDNKVTTKYFAAPGDLFAVDSLGRIIGFINRVNLQDPTVEEKLKNWHLNWNPECEMFMESIYTGTGTTGTQPTYTQPHFYTTSFVY
ncbi:uncharacterized protein LOC134820409 [Bolinopsis microptera]|uniref:uncharacterized protein LOC134820409 n=1 Tax=Bolinopsis microptera TaxID=2820187 RepID=UPI00307918A8